MNKLLVAIFLLATTLNLPAQGKKVNLEDVWKSYAFYAKTTHGLNSMNDGEHYTAITSADGKTPTIEKFSYKTGESTGYIISTKMIEEQTGKKISFDTYQFSPDETKVLLGTDTESIYRHSSKSNYYIYDLKNGKLDSLRSNGKQQLASFSPTRNLVAFVHDNHMHIQDFDDPTKEIISFGNGEDDAFIAGAVDWVYEEEFGFDKGYEWSPDGNHIAYYQFDERQVSLFSMDVYGTSLYPGESEFKYPKAGEKNSKVDIHLFDVQKQEDLQIPLMDEYEYIPRIKWTSGTKEPAALIIYTLNRLQNELRLYKAKPNVGNANLAIDLLYKETAPHYLEINDDIRFLSDGSFIWTSERNGYNHLYHISAKGEIKKQITSGDWDVTAFYGIDTEKKILYYQSAEESPLRRSVYSIGLNGKAKKKLSTRIGWNSAEFSDGFKYYIHNYSSKDTPTIETLHTQNGDLVRVINNNSIVKERMQAYQLASKDFFTFKTEEGTELNGWMMKPSDFDPTKKYPVLMFVYGGPGSQTVKDQYDGFNHFYYETLAAKGYIIVSVDNRGTGARGRDFRTLTYGQLGKYETEDQISAAKYLSSQSYIDGERIGIWGWSYGGYMSSLALTKGADVFKMAIAVAPVTNWRFYDSIYTERYMGIPQDNAKGYDDNSPINHVAKMEGNYFLVHGSADDNVHFQNTMRMTEALVQADKQFDMFVYPDKTHGIAGGNTRFHLYTKMTDFITDNL